VGVDGGGYEIAASYDLGIGCEALEQSITIRKRSEDKEDMERGQVYFYFAKRLHVGVVGSRGLDAYSFAVIVLSLFLYSFGMLTF
jgi:hypothetical protein